MAYPGATAIMDNSATAVDRKELALKVYAETLEAFNRSNVGLATIMQKTIQSGKSAQFIVAGKSDGTDVVTHTPGTQIDVTASEFSERTIVVNDLEYVAKRIDAYEEAMAHYDSRGPITRMMGESLAYKMDKVVLAAVETAAGATGLASNPGGTTVTNAVIRTGATVKAKGDALAEAIFSAAAALRANDDTGQAVCVVSPTNYAALVQSGNGVNADYTSGNGGFDSGTIMQVAGVRILQSNNLPPYVLTSHELQGLVYTEQAVGLVSLVGLTTEQTYQEDFFATLMTGRYAYGAGTLRPESAVKIMSA